MEKSKSIDNRARNFTCVVYPESAPENFISILDSFHIPIFISPLHDKDLNSTGEAKKPHYHIIVMFEGKKTLQQVYDIFDKVNGVYCDREIVVKSLRSMARYLCHLDNPEKYQYRIEDVISLGGADYISVIELAIDKFTVITEITRFIDEHNLISFTALSRYCRDYNPTWYRCIVEGCSYYIKEYLKTSQWEMQNNLYENLVVDNDGTVKKIVTDKNGVLKKYVNDNTFDETKDDSKLD